MRLISPISLVRKRRFVDSHMIFPAIAFGL
jgi:hypothetical protein